MNMSHAACKVYLLLTESKLLEPKPTVLSVGRAQNCLRKEDSGKPLVEDS